MQYKYKNPAYSKINIRIKTDDAINRLPSLAQILNTKTRRGVHLSRFEAYVPELLCLTKFFLRHGTKGSYYYQ